MNPEQNAADEKLQSTYNPLKVMQPGERVVCEITRHPFGLIGLYVVSGLLAAAVLAAAVLAPHYLTSLTSQIKMGIVAGAAIVLAMIALYTYVAVVVYRGNRWIVTTDSLTQISQVSLFRKQTSQLSLANLEDVTIEQDGLIPSLFGFGRLRAETAGERSKFVFEFCPKPAENARQIIAVHEAYIAERPDEMRTTNRALTNTANFNQPSAAPQQPAPAYDQPASGQPAYGTGFDTGSVPPQPWVQPPAVNPVPTPPLAPLPNQPSDQPPASTGGQPLSQ